VGEAGKDEEESSCETSHGNHAMLGLIPDNGIISLVYFTLLTTATHEEQVHVPREKVE
jgi:hypothetical protein